MLERRLERVNEHGVPCGVPVRPAGWTTIPGAECFALVVTGRKCSTLRPPYGSLYRLFRQGTGCRSRPIGEARDSLG
jgi:hypothetical protein